MAIGMILVGRLGGQSYNRKTKEIVDRIYRGLERVAENRQRVGIHSNQELHDDNDDVGGENAAQDPANPRRFIARVCSAGHACKLVSDAERVNEEPTTGDERLYPAALSHA